MRRNLTHFALIVLSLVPPNSVSRYEPQLNERYAKIPVLSYGELLQDPARYEGQLVRVSGMLVYGFEISHLYDPQAELPRTWVEFERSYLDCTPAAVEKERKRLSKPPKTKNGEVWAFWDLRAHVTLFGVFQTERGHYGHTGNPYQLVVKCIERIEPETNRR